MSEKNQDEGQVSEVGGLGDPGEQVSDGDAVSGQPEGESGKVNDGPAGPEAPSEHRDRKDRYPDKGDVETTG